MIYKCEGCRRVSSRPDYDEETRCVKPLWWRNEKDVERGLCPRCALEWFKRLARGERAEWVTRGKR